MKAVAPLHAPPVEPSTARTWLRLRLQVMLAKLDYRLSKTSRNDQTEDTTSFFLAATCEMAMLAAEGGLGGFAETALRMAERMDALRRQRHLPEPALQALTEWLLHADRYLRRPSSRVRCVSLVNRLNDAAWGNPLSWAEWGKLINEFARDSNVETSATALECHGD